MNISKFRSSTETRETRSLKKVKVNWKQQARKQIGTRSVWFVIGISIINTHILKVIIQKRARELPLTHSHTHTHTHTHTLAASVSETNLACLIFYNIIFMAVKLLRFTYNIPVPESHRDSVVGTATLSDLECPKL